MPIVVMLAFVWLVSTNLWAEFLTPEGIVSKVLGSQLQVYRNDSFEFPELDAVKIKLFASLGHRPDRANWMTAAIAYILWIKAANHRDQGRVQIGDVASFLPWLDKSVELRLRGLSHDVVGKLNPAYLTRYQAESRLARSALNALEQTLADRRKSLESAIETLGFHSLSAFEIALALQLDPESLESFEVGRDIWFPIGTPPNTMCLDTIRRLATGLSQQH